MPPPSPSATSTSSPMASVAAVLAVDGRSPKSAFAAPSELGLLPGYSSVGKSLRSVVDRAAADVTSKLQAAVRQSTSSSLEGTMLRRVAAEVEDVMRKLANGIPPIEGDDAVFAASSEDDVTRLSRKNAFLFQSVQELRTKIEEQREVSSQLAGKLKRKDGILDYIRKTLYQEVVLLRERLFSKDQLQRLDAGVVSLLDNLRLSDQENEATVPLESTLQQMKEQYDQQREKVVLFFQEQLADKDAKIESLEEQLGRVQGQAGRLKSSHDAEVRGLREQLRRLQATMEAEVR
eukprot:RCo048821